ncbi:MAG TPA: hypothetical protein VGC62_22950 [Pseudomonas sp.]|uniref:hypothetical protein n=1 Tax=Pseudomonas sp. TaxID=306 RepID=UPI002ED82298
MIDIRIGISGWRYVPWRGDSCPARLLHKNEPEDAPPLLERRGLPDDLEVAPGDLRGITF